MTLRKKIGAAVTRGPRTLKIHYTLLQYPLFTNLRKRMLDRIAAPTDLRVIDYDEIISHPQTIRYIAKFMHQIGLLG